MKIVLDNIFVFDDGEQIIAEHTNDNGDVVWAEIYETIEDARTAYTDHATAGKYREAV